MKVYLIGAGPGDAGLLTLKGRDALACADVVVYDALANDSLLGHARPDAERIYVGKVAGNHALPQHEINALLVRKAKEGKVVARLKGGDPYIFGRGGEEAEELLAAGVPFEEVPGISSTIAAPAYAGIPLTHRNFASSVTIITGHENPDKPGSVHNWKALAASASTLVFVMGMKNLPDIARHLLDAGMEPQMPAAVVEKGTTPAQRRISATLGTLPAVAEEAGVVSPAVIVVGKVCALAEDFDWFDRLPLKGKRVVVTRPRERSGTLSARLRSLGADVWEYPCIATVPLDPCPAVDEAMERLSDYEWLALTSPAGAEALWNWLEGHGRDARALGAVKLAAIGPGTARALAAHGLKADYVPQVYDAAHLGEGLPATGKVLALRAEEGSPALTEALARRNIACDDVASYRTVYDNPRSRELRAAVEGTEGLLVTFTSASTVKGFVSSVGEDTDFSRMVGMCIGQQTANQAKKYGIPVRVAREATMDALVELITEGV